MSGPLATGGGGGATGIETKFGTSTGLSSVGSVDIAGLTGFTLEANTWYRLEMHYIWTSTASNFQINFVTTGTFITGGATPATGVAQSSATVISFIAYFSSATNIVLRGSVGENRSNIGFYAQAVFKTGTAGTAKVQLQLLSGTTLNTINSAIVLITKLGA